MVDKLIAEIGNAGNRLLPIYEEIGCKSVEIAAGKVFIVIKKLETKDSS